VPAAVGIGGTQGTVIFRVSVEVAVDICGGHGVDCCTGENGGVVDGKRSGGTDDGNEVRNEVGCVENDAGCGTGGRRDSGEGGGRTKDVGRSDVGTVEGMTSVSKDASTRLFVVKRPGRGPGRFFVNAGEALEVFAAFRGDLCTGFVFTFTLDLERVFRGETRDGPGSAAAATGRARLSGWAVRSNSRFFEICCSWCSSPYEM
jgi:hypothetical protein